MHKLKKHRIVMVLLTMVLMFGVSAQSTLAYLQADTDPVKNTFAPVKSVVHDLEISVTGEKILNGRDWQEGDSFIFILQEWDAAANEWVTKGTESVAYDKGSKTQGTFDMSELVKEQLEATGTYNFRIVEGAGSIANVTYDSKKCRFDVTVTADQTGAMDITAVKDRENTNVQQDDASGNFAVDVQFTNTYVKPPEPPVKPDPEELKFNFEINKSVKNVGSKKIGPEGFDFQLEKDSTGEIWTKTSNADGDAVFHMSYDKEDIGKVYIYELTEIDDGQAGVTYDTREYEIKVGIELDEEDNVLVPTITLDGKKVGKVEVDFNNTYEAPEEPTQPSEPSEPDEPTDPSEPDEPTTEPDEPTDPSEPSEPEEPTQPSEPSDEPDEPTTDQPTKPGEKPTDQQPSDGDQTQGTDAPGKDKGTQTGDDSSMFLYFALMITSAIIMALLFIGHRRKLLSK